MRYQVVTYSQDIGSDERMDFSRLSDALKDARAYRGREEYAAVYDSVKKIAFVVFGNIFTSVFADYVTVVSLE